MRILIHDASVLIDLIAVDLLDSALTLPYVMETTDLVKREILRAGQEDVLARMVEARKLDVIRSSNEEIGVISELHSLIPALSLADCSVLFHAAAKGAVVLSGDALLRRTAKERSLTVHGTLWIFTELVGHGLVSAPDAALILERLMGINRRLPVPECRKLLTLWRIR
jgi:predicted nucleic acid-binding protein